MKKSKSGRIWFLQAVSGVALALLLGLHWTAQHYVVKGSLRSYADVILYLNNPVIFVIEMIFLIFVTVHALLGVRAILIDLGLPSKVQRIIDVSTWMLGIFTIIYGIQLAWQIIH